MMHRITTLLCKRNYTVKFRECACRTKCFSEEGRSFVFFPVFLRFCFFVPIAYFSPSNTAADWQNNMAMLRHLHCLMALDSNVHYMSWDILRLVFLCEEVFLMVWGKNDGGFRWTGRTSVRLKQPFKKRRNELVECDWHALSLKWTFLPRTIWALHSLWISKETVIPWK